MQRLLPSKVRDLLFSKISSPYDDEQRHAVVGEVIYFVLVIDFIQTFSDIRPV